MKLSAKDQAEMEKAQELLATGPDAQMGLARSMFFGRLPLGRLLPIPHPGHEERVRADAIIADTLHYLQHNSNPVFIDREHHIPEEVRRGLGRLGVLGLTVPREYGGQGLSHASYCRVLEHIAVRDGSLAVFIGAHQSIGLKAILLKGTEEQKKRFLPDLARGDKVAAFALTEPEAGSDAANLQSRAEAQPDGGWLLTGQKRYITNGAYAGVLTVMAKTRDPASGKDKVSAFLVTPQDPGFKVVRNDRMKMGIRGTWQAELAFERIHLPADRVLGEVGGGFKVALSVLNFGRCTLAAGCVGGARAAYRKTLEHVKARKQFGRRLADLELVKKKVGRMAESLVAMDAMVAAAAGCVDRGDPDLMLETGMTKLYCSEVAYKIVDDCLQLHGGAGYMEDVGLERGLRDARINRIVEGASELMHSFVALVGMKGVGEEFEQVLGWLKHPVGHFGDLGRFMAHEWKDVLVGHGEDPSLALGVHRGLHEESLLVSELVRTLARTVTATLAKHKEKIIGRQVPQERIARMATETYAAAATLALLDGHLQTHGDKQPEDVAFTVAAGRSFIRQARRRILAHQRHLEHEGDCDHLRLKLADLAVGPPPA